jgi:cytochrome c5
VRLLVAPAITVLVLLTAAACQSDEPTAFGLGPGGLPQEASAPRTSPVDADGRWFAEDAFPPPLPGDESHGNAWGRSDCLLCHDLGIRSAPRVKHRGMPAILRSAQCRSCHLPGSVAGGDGFAPDAFPPELPGDEPHSGAWNSTPATCMACHRQGVLGAPRVQHRGMSFLLLESQCRSCHLPRR